MEWSKIEDHVEKWGKKIEYTEQYMAQVMKGVLKIEDSQGNDVSHSWLYQNALILSDMRRAYTVLKSIQDWV